MQTGQCGFTIQKAGPQHAAEAGVLQVLTWQHAYEGIVPRAFLQDMNPGEWAKSYLRLIANPDIEYYLPRVDGQPAGRLALCGTRDEDAAPLTGEICALYLLRPYWGKGYGKSLMDFALNRLQARGYTRATLWVLEQNLRGRLFYEKCGFTPDGVRKTIELNEEKLQELRYQRSLDILANTV